MQRHAFVGETMPDPIADPEEREERRSGMWLGTMAAVALAIALGAVLVGETITPFFWGDAVIVFIIAITPALIAGGIFLLQDGGRLPLLDDIPGLSPMQIRVWAFAYLILVPPQYLLLANQRLDASSATIEATPVVRTYVTHSRRSGTHYYAEVATRMRSPLAGYSLYGAREPISISYQTYQRVVAGQSSFLLREHTGVFRIPWYEPHPHLVE